MEKEKNHLSRPFDEDKMNTAIETMTIRKATGLENIFVRFAILSRKPNIGYSPYIKK